MMERVHWQDWLVILIGLAIAAAPFVLNYTLTEGLSSRLILVGFVLSGIVGIVLGGVGAFSEFEWQEWATGLLGVWLAAMPWVVGFASVRVLMLASVIAGLILVVLAVLALRAISQSGHA